MRADSLPDKGGSFSMAAPWSSHTKSLDASLCFALLLDRLDRLGLARPTKVRTKAKSARVYTNVQYMYTLCYTAVFACT